MIDQIFGSLTVLERAPDRFHQRNDRPNGRGRRRKYWLVQCSCGTESFELDEYKLKNGAQACRSCTHSGENNSKRTHGESDAIIRGKRSAASPEYRCWKAAKNRCYNQKFKQYNDYGGRGIRMCDRWLNSFEDFLADMGRKPTLSHSIQRQDNDGDYSPDNCHWGTDKEQRRNKRTTHWITIDGETKSRIEWLEELGVSKSTFGWRKKHGWSVEEALFGR